MAPSHDQRPTDDVVRYTYEGPLVTAIDVESGVAASGRSKSDALDALADALELHEGGGDPIEDEDEFLRNLGGRGCP